MQEPQIRAGVTTYGREHTMMISPITPAMGEEEGTIRVGRTQDGKLVMVVRMPGVDPQFVIRVEQGQALVIHLD